jgi:hypothetical protein
LAFMARYFLVQPKPRPPNSMAAPSVATLNRRGTTCGAPFASAVAR